MAKFRAKSNAPYPYREGDIVEFQEPLVGGYVNHFEDYAGDAEVTNIYDRNPLNDPTAGGTQLDLGRTPGGSTSTEVVVNPSREELKAEADELGINYAPNIPTDRLFELVKEARAKKDAE